VINSCAGDWVHIRNANDVSKPIVAQLFRLWSDQSGQKWVNACWYYRPEQTVHRHDKHFLENEVFKTGRYKDHRIEEVEDICYVMFQTRYFKGRPRGFPPDKSVYVCESRYNEEKHTFNKIKTWNSVLPDEVRDRDYEMDIFEAPRPIRKEPSKIKHLLQLDAKETDDFPKPTWGAPNAPPMIGAVHRRPRGPNVGFRSFVFPEEEQRLTDAPRTRHPPRRCPSQQCARPWERTSRRASSQRRRLRTSSSSRLLRARYRKPSLVPTPRGNLRLDSCRLKFMDRWHPCPTCSSTQEWPTCSRSRCQCTCSLRSTSRRILVPALAKLLHPSSPRSLPLRSKSTTRVKLTWRLLLTPTVSKFLPH